MMLLLFKKTYYKVIIATSLNPRIAIKGPELPSVDFMEALEVFKEKNSYILL